eukprot:gene30946-41192_t
MDIEEFPQPVTLQESLESQAEEESKIRAAQDLFGGSGQKITRAEKERLDQEAAVQANEIKSKELESKRRANLDQIEQNQQKFQEAAKMAAEKVATDQLAIQAQLDKEEKKKTVTQRLKERAQEQDRQAFEAEVEKRRIAELAKTAQSARAKEPTRAHDQRLIERDSARRIEELQRQEEERVRKSSRTAAQLTTSSITPNAVTVNSSERAAKLREIAQMEEQLYHLRAQLIPMPSSATDGTTERANTELTQIMATAVAASGTIQRGVRQPSSRLPTPDAQFTGNFMKRVAMPDIAAEVVKELEAEIHQGYIPYSAVKRQDMHAKCKMSINGAVMDYLRDRTVEADYLISRTMIVSGCHGKGAPNSTEIQSVLTRISTRLKLNVTDYKKGAERSIPADGCVVIRLLDPVPFVYRYDINSALVPAMLFNLTGDPYISARKGANTPQYTVQAIDDRHGHTLKNAKTLCVFAGIPRNQATGTMVMLEVIRSFLAMAGIHRDHTCVVINHHYAQIDNNGGAILEYIATVFWTEPDPDGTQYEEAQETKLSINPKHDQVFAVQCMGYNLEMMRSIKQITPYYVQRITTSVEHLTRCTYIHNIPPRAHAADILHDLRCNHDNSAVLGDQGENVALAYVLPEFKVPNSAKIIPPRFVIHWYDDVDSPQLNMSHFQDIYLEDSTWLMSVETNVPHGLIPYVEIGQARVKHRDSIPAVE